MDLSKINDNILHERAGPKQNANGTDSYAQVTYRKNDIVVILPQNHNRKAKITVTSEPENNGPSFLSSIIAEFPSILTRCIKSLFRVHGN